MKTIKTYKSGLTKEDAIAIAKALNTRESNCCDPKWVADPDGKGGWAVIKFAPAVIEHDQAILESEWVKRGIKDLKAGRLVDR
jgi:hypothetical protein